MSTGAPIAKSIIIVLDSLGVGSTPDADHYEDRGANTLAHIAEDGGGIKIPNLSKMGLANLTFTRGGDRTEETNAYFGKMRQRSAGKDSSSGHWEIAGLDVPEFPAFEEGFPPELMTAISDKIGHTVLGNTIGNIGEVIAELGPRHLSTGQPIVFSSDKSVMQVAAHADILARDQLYHTCTEIREVCNEYQIPRVIARPFTGSEGMFEPSPFRKDFSISPPGTTVLEALDKQGIPVHAIGKVGPLFNNEGVTNSLETIDNMDGVKKIIDLTQDCETNDDGQCVIFANLSDFDTLFAQNNDAKGYARALEEFDRHLLRIMRALEQDDALIITADHGNDPTFGDHEHTREHVPLIYYSRKNRPKKSYGSLGVRKTLADIAETLAEAYEIEANYGGVSFWSQVNNLAPDGSRYSEYVGY